MKMPSVTTAPIILYVAGYGRSGSTYFDIIMGSHPRAISLGEVGLFWEIHQRPDTQCSCGQPYNDCAQWGPIISDLGAMAGAHKLEKLCRQIEGIVSGLFYRFSSKRTRYAEANQFLFDRLKRPASTEVFIDSSKTAYRFAWRPIALKRIALLNVKVVHLIRKPEDVLRSCLKGRNSNLAAGIHRERFMESLITIFGWVAANLCASLNCWIIGKKNVVRLSFNELVERPEDALAKIGDCLRLDLGSVVHRIRSGEPFFPGHLVAGNRMAQQKEIYSTCERVEAKIVLSIWQKLICVIVARPLYNLLMRRC